MCRQPIAAVRSEGTHTTCCLPLLRDLEAAFLLELSDAVAYSWPRLSIYAVSRLSPHEVAVVVVVGQLLLCVLSQMPQLANVVLCCELRQGTAQTSAS